MTYASVRPTARSFRNRRPIIFHLGRKRVRKRVDFDEEAEGARCSFALIFKKPQRFIDRKNFIGRTCREGHDSRKGFPQWSLLSFNYVIKRSVVRTDVICAPYRFLSILPHSLHRIENLICQVLTVMRFRWLQLKLIALPTTEKREGCSSRLWNNVSRKDSTIVRNIFVSSFYFFFLDSVV